jgi:N-methylhydantoinase B
MSIAYVSILSGGGVRGGRGGAPAAVVIAPGGPNEREAHALADDDPVAAGEVVRIRTTGGGGWGDPLGREPALVARDVWWGKVSRRSAEADYGVVLAEAGEPDLCPRVDAAATEDRRDRLREERGDRPFFDRGPGYAELADGATHSPFDVREDD